VLADASAPERRAVSERGHELEPAREGMHTPQLRFGPRLAHHRVRPTDFGTFGGPDGWQA